MKKLTRIQLERDTFFFGVGGSGRSPLESADPQVRRAERRGETESGKLWLGRLGKGFRAVGAGVDTGPHSSAGPPRFFEELTAIIKDFAPGCPAGSVLVP